MLMRPAVKRVALLAAILAASTGIRAELSPWVYKERQEKAPEALVIKVLSVSKRETTEAKWKQIEFTVDAECRRWNAKP